ncbi:MAG: hypothetical protein QOE43_2397 [Gaiellaceae bacterium]|nr:hypothetical protein [Gaiellaceae bacterium]
MRWALVLALALAPVALATGSTGWFHLGDGGTPSTSSLNGAVYAMNGDSPSNGLFVGGNFTTAGGRPAAHLATWYASGRWGVFPAAATLNGDVHAIAWDASHVRLFVGGTFTNAGGDPNADFLAMWDPSAQRFVSFCSPAPAFGGSVSSLQIIGSTLYVGGAFQNGAGIKTANYLLACDLNTGAARAVGKPGDLTGGVYALTRDANGTLYAGGQFSNVAGIPAADHVVSYDGSWHALGSGVSAGGGAVDDYVRSLGSNGNDVYIGTDSVNVAGIAQADHVAKWNGSAWSALGANAAGTDGWLPQTAFIYAIAATSSQVVVTGSFQNADGNATADHIASFAGGAWKPLGSDGAGNGPFIGNGLALAVVGKDIYAGGNFTSAGGDGHASYIARFTPQSAPSNLFTIVGLKNILAKGAVTLTVHTPGAGSLTLRGVGVQSVRAAAPSAADVNLTVQATGRTKKTLNRAGRLKVKVTITFTPTGGTTRSRSVVVLLKTH